MASLSQALEMTADMIEGSFDVDTEPASRPSCPGSDTTIPATIWMAVNENEIPHVTHALNPSCGWWTRGGLFTWRFEICGASDSPGIGLAAEDVAKPHPTIVVRLINQYGLERSRPRGGLFTCLKSE